MSALNDNVKRNPNGKTLEEFLRSYDPARYERPSVTVDMAVIADEREILLIRRKDHPNIDTWALPGGFLNMEETLFAAAARELEEETGVTNVPLRPLGMYGDPSRDPRTRIITCAFSALVCRNDLRIQSGDDAQDAALFTFDCRPVGGWIDLPQTKKRAYKIDLPTTACGVPMTEKVQPYEMHFSGVDSRGIPVHAGALVALDERKMPVLLDTLEGTEEIAGDHPLIIFAALLEAGLIKA